jgi:hypothetical protein
VIGGGLDDSDSIIGLGQEWPDAHDGVIEQKCQIKVVPWASGGEVIGGLMDVSQCGSEDLALRGAQWVADTPRCKTEQRIVADAFGSAQRAQERAVALRQRI